MKFWIIIGAILSAISVIIGAFGSHGLKDKLNPDQMLVYNTATRYLMYHSIGILVLGVLAYNVPVNVVKIPLSIMLLGIILFSGSLYVISLKGLTNLGIVTPFGGFAFIVSWLLLALNIYRLP